MALASSTMDCNPRAVKTLKNSGSPSSIERHWWKWRKYAVRLDNGALFVSKTSSDWRPSEKDIIAIHNCAMDGGETRNVNRIHGEMPTEFRGQWWRQYFWTTLGQKGYLGPFGPIWANWDHIWPLWLKNLVSRYNTHKFCEQLCFWDTLCNICNISGQAESVKIESKYNVFYTPGPYKFFFSSALALNWIRWAAANQI